MYKKNIFISILRELEIPFTNAFASSLYDEHPYKYTFYGLQSLCQKFNIDTKGIFIHDKQTLQDVSTPFVAHYNNDYVLVKKINSREVTFESYGVDHSISTIQFQNSCSGCILLLFPSENSIEPNYREHIVKRRKHLAELCLLLVCTLFLLCNIVITRPTFKLREIIMMILYICGCTFSGMLLAQQMKLNHPILNHVCHVFRHSSCSNVLESKDAKLIGRYSWAEIGFCYFLVNVIALMSTEHAYNVLALFAAISVPYSIWSIWYQHRLAQWCPLCVMVQIVLASQFVSCIFVGDYSLPIQLDTHTIIFLSIAYISSILALNMVLPILSHSLELKEVRWRYNHIKMDKQVFSLLLNTGDNYDVDCYSSIKFGNVDSDTVVTIFSNPYCNPCAIMHKRLQALYASNTCIIQYIFTSFKPEWDVINKCLIAIYQQYSVEEAWHIYTEWYDHGKLSQEYFFDKYNIDIHTDDIEREFQQHEQWKKITNLNSTPTILVNGHKIPYGYTVEDIQYVS